ncbi:hypothetical protein [Micromonospora sp. CA-244673]|uniref:hypothetical protein n=1 Tax=Micromonospora sp. CA-244673 TaxID=3239958 RepID=UPI003D9344D0
MATLQREVTIRRSDKLPFVFMAMLTGAACYAAIAAPLTLKLATVPILLTMDFVAFLGGPAAYLTITPTHVIVANPLVRHAVPRSLTDGIQSWTRPNIELRIHGQSPISLRAVVPGLAGPSPVTVAEHERRMRRVLEALDSVPASNGVQEQVRSQRRLAHFVALGVLVVALICGLFILGTHRGLIT